MTFRPRHRALFATIGAVAAAALTLTGCSGGGGGGGSADENTLDKGAAAQINDAVESAMQLSGSTSAIVGVWTPDGNLVQSYGDDGVESNALFRAAQASQPFNCALLLSEVEQGKMQLDDKITKDLTRQVGVDDITYAQLCDQTSGLADFKFDINGEYRQNPERPWTDRELLAHGLVKSPLKWPGLDVNVSDTNALLLGRTLYVGQNEPLGDQLDDNVFEQANMDDTYLPSSHTVDLPEGSLTGVAYQKDGDDYVCDVDPTDYAKVSSTMLGTANSAVTTVTDLKDFYESYFGGDYGTESDQKLLTEAVPTKNPERDKDGKPKEEPAEVEPGAQEWSFGVEKVGPLYGRSGEVPGTLTAAYHDPETDYTVVAVLNNSSAGSGFVRNFAFELATISAENGVGMDVPWTLEGQQKALSDAAVCQ